MSPLLSIVENENNLAPVSEERRIRRYCEWIRDRLLVRTDAYVTFDESGRKYSPWDLAGDRTKKKTLTPQAIIRHAQGNEPICLYAISTDNQSKWIAWDLDNHDADGVTCLRNTDYVLHLTEVLRQRLGFRPLVESSDGQGGYHAWVLFQDFVPSVLGYQFAHWVVEVLCDWRDFLAQAPECFPKQPQLTATCRYGSSLRVPGRHPTRDTWSAVLSQDGDHWIPWPYAIDDIITYTGDPVDLIPAEARDHPIPQHREFRQSDHQFGHECERLVTSVADYFNMTRTWESVLEPHGWQIVQIVGDVQYWRRPGKHEPGHSATTGYCGDKLFVFSADAQPFEAEKAYTKFQAFTILNHDGDPNAAESHIFNNSINGGIL